MATNLQCQKCGRIFTTPVDWGMVICPECGIIDWIIPILKTTIEMGNSDEWTKLHGN